MYKIKVIPYPKLKRDWIGKLVRSKVDMQNHYAHIPKGTLFEVEYASRRLELLTFHCDCCNSRLKITIKSNMEDHKEHIEFLEIVDE
ncbi:MAG: hypothetical protein ACRC0X_02280 [Brevinema sp.]